MRAGYLVMALMVIACADEDSFVPAGPTTNIHVTPIDLSGPSCRPPTLADGRWPARAPNDGQPDMVVPHQGFIDIEVKWPRSDRQRSTQPIWDACFAARVENAKGELVWELENLCASDYGPGGKGGIGLLYVGACDAGEGQTQNRLTLTLERACGSNGEAIRGLALPCADGCERAFRCVEDEDAAVRFELR